jgi:hypothetical protein
MIPARSSLGKIFCDLIERVRFARTLRWREIGFELSVPRRIGKGFEVSSETGPIEHLPAASAHAGDARRIGLGRAFAGHPARFRRRHSGCRLLPLFAFIGHIRLAAHIHTRNHTLACFDRATGLDCGRSRCR